MGVIGNIIKWAIRVVACIFGLWYPVLGELILSGVALVRFDSDEIVRVVTGFVGDDEFGHYEYNDNSVNRFIGWTAYVGVVVSRCLIVVNLAVMLGFISPELVPDLLFTSMG